MRGVHAPDADVDLGDCDIGLYRAVGDSVQARSRRLYGFCYSLRFVSLSIDSAEHIPSVREYEYEFSKLQVKASATAFGLLRGWGPSALKATQRMDQLWAVRDGMPKIPSELLCEPTSDGQDQESRLRSLFLASPSGFHHLQTCDLESRSPQSLRIPGFGLFFGLFAAPESKLLRFEASDCMGMRLRFVLCDGFKVTRDLWSPYYRFLNRPCPSTYS